MEFRARPKIGWSNVAGEGSSFEIRTVYELLDVIRKKTGIFIGRPSLTALSAYVDGFQSALCAIGAPLEDEHPPFQGFHDWIAVRYGYAESTLGWVHMLLESVEGNENAAFQRFFAELDEYRCDA